MTPDSQVLAAMEQAQKDRIELRIEAEAVFDKLYITHMRFKEALLTTDTDLLTAMLNLMEAVLRLHKRLEALERGE